MHIYKKKDQYEENFKFQLINKQRSIDIEYLF